MAAIVKQHVHHFSGFMRETTFQNKSQQYCYNELFFTKDKKEEDDLRKSITPMSFVYLS